MDRDELVDKLTKDERYDAFVEGELKAAAGEPILRDVLASRLQGSGGLTFDHAGRVVRAAVERLQERGVAIVTHPDGGFYITEDPERVRDEARRFMALCEAHAKRYKVLHRIADRIERERQDGGQRELFGNGR